MKKKKGSSLVLVVCMFAILSIIIISIMGMTVSGYNLRKQQNKRIENFYGADSGLEIAYKITQDVVQAAIEFGNSEVDRAVAENNSKPEAEKKDLDYNAKNEIFRKNFISYIKLNYAKKIEDQTEYDKYKRDMGNIKVEVVNKDSLKEEVEKEKFDEKNKDMTFINAELLSTFTDKENKNRQVGVDYKIVIPDYGVEISAGVGNGSNLLDYLIGTDGSLNMDISGSLNLYGDMWVNGKTQSNASLEKGINLIGDPSKKETIVWDGEVVTKENLYLENMKVNFYKDIYAKNIFIEGENFINTRTAQAGGYENPNPKDIYVYNDLVINSDETNIAMNNYYGLNDINEYEKNNYNMLSEAERSSSIIINTDELKSGGASSIKANEMYIAGTAYLGGKNETDVLRNYQSGESIVINRNTMPYTDRNLGGDYVYEYKKPLHIIDQIYVNNNYEDIGLYYKIDENTNQKKLGKIDLVEKFYGVGDYATGGALNTNAIPPSAQLDVGEIWSTGVSYSNGKVNSGMSIKKLNELSEKIKAKQDRYVDEVFLRNEEPKDGNYSFWNPSQETSIETSIKWEAIKNVMQKDEIYNTKHGEVQDSTHEVIFEKQNIVGLNVQDANNCVVFKSTKDIGGLLPHVSDTEIHTIQKREVNLIFNLGDKDVEINIEKEGSDDGKIYIKNDPSEEISIVISKSNIGIKLDSNSSGGSIRAHIIALTTKDLNYKMSGSCELGSFDDNKFLLNNVFKEIFKYSELENVFNPDENNGDLDESENLIDINKLIKKERWKLVK